MSELASKPAEHEISTKNDKVEQNLDNNNSGNLSGDYGNMSILLFLYFLQGQFSTQLVNSALYCNESLFLQAFHSEYQWRFQYFCKIEELHIRNKLFSLSPSIHSHVSIYYVCKRV